MELAAEARHFTLAVMTTNPRPLLIVDVDDPATWPQPLADLFQKLGIRNRLEVTRYAIRVGLIELQGRPRRGSDGRMRLTGASQVAGSMRRCPGAPGTQPRRSTLSPRPP